MSILHKKRIVVITSFVLGCSLALALVLFALSKNINLFYSPSDLSKQKIKLDQTIRVGGMVVNNSIKRTENLGVRFTITDYENTLEINYQGILPDLFKEGQGVVALGVLDKQGHFQATQILAKHDEKYMPPEVKASLKTANLEAR